MKSISIFNNKGGVGKTTLSFHLAHSLAEMGHKTLIIDLDPQCNLTILSMDEEAVHDIWHEEDPYIDDFQKTREKFAKSDFNKLTDTVRSIHFLLMPTQEGTAELDKLPPPHKLAKNLDLIPGRLTMHLYENKISSRWSDVYQGDPLAIRTITRIRELAKKYSEEYGYSVVIMDTSPSLGSLNKVVISITDGFLIPCMPDMFSLYGVKNIGSALKIWKKEFDTIYGLLSDEKRKNFPERFIQLLGYTIYNAKKRTDAKNEWQLAKAHFNYAKEIPEAIEKFIELDIRRHLNQQTFSSPIGGTATMHTHNTFPNMAQKYHIPMWKLPNYANLESEDAITINPNQQKYKDTAENYKKFTTDLLQRMNTLGE